ncbi:MAG TPA: hypothetical protein VJY33_15995 [Isosphaeraceae bacterium]|nr:hypothetical protein [Isosphaeraceae bacterium]
MLDLVLIPSERRRVLRTAALGDGVMLALLPIPVRPPSGRWQRFA